MRKTNGTVNIDGIVVVQCEFQMDFFTAFLPFTFSYVVHVNDEIYDESE